MGTETMNALNTALLLVSSAVLGTSQDVKQCPDDWFDADDLGCFKFLDSAVNLTWIEAQLACEKEGGYLAEPVNHWQSLFLGELAILEGSFTDIGYWYIGLTDLAHEGEWIWMHSGEAVTEAAWGSNCPTNRTMNSDDCAMLAIKNNHVSWEDHNCLSPDVKHHAVAPVCQRDTTSSQPQTTTEQPETTPAETCPSEWSEFNSNCYKFFGLYTYWADADTFCSQEGGSITSVHSKEEQKFLQSLANGSSFWLGGYMTNHGMVWSDGTDFDYDNIQFTSSGTCLFLNSIHYDSGWTMADCQKDGIGYICKNMN